MTQDRVIDVRISGKQDRMSVCRMLADAFQDDPVMTFIFPDPNVRRARLPAFFAVIYDGDGLWGPRFVSGGLEAATLWRPPGRGHLSFREKASQSLLPWLRAARTALPRALQYSAASDANHPDQPHWYLHIAGCAPAHQGRGFGTAAIKAGLQQADADRVPSYLETAKETNIAYYQSLGFEVTHTWHVRNGPQNWSMLRPCPIKQ